MNNEHPTMNHRFRTSEVPAVAPTASVSIWRTAKNEVRWSVKVTATASALDPAALQQSAVAAYQVAAELDAQLEADFSRRGPRAVS